jgi:hypothetical protein
VTSKTGRARIREEAVEVSGITKKKKKKRRRENVLLERPFLVS